MIEIACPVCGSNNIEELTQVIEYRKIKECEKKGFLSSEYDEKEIKMIEYKCNNCFFTSEKINTFVKGNPSKIILIIR